MYNYTVECIPVYTCIYSGTSDNGHSEKQTTSVELTNCLSPTNCIQYPLR